MDRARLASLRAYYASLSDEALFAEADLGREAFSSEAWTIIAEQIEVRGIARDPADQHPPTQDAAGVTPPEHAPSRLERLAAHLDALPPSIKPAAFGAGVIVVFAMNRGALIILPILVLYLFATTPNPWASLMTLVGVFLLALAGGALSGLAYGFVGRHLRTVVRGGYYLTGIVTLAPYVVVLTYIVRLTDGVPMTLRPRGEDMVVSVVMTLVLGIVMGRAWFRPDEESEVAKQRP